MSEKNTEISTKEQMRKELEFTFGKAEYPVKGISDFVTVFPNGPFTEFKAGDVSVSVIELSKKADNGANFPYDSVESLVDDIMLSLEEDGKFR